MNKEHQYKLEKGSKKHHCPNCNNRTFVFYVDSTTGDYLPEQYGRCDRESKCSYHLNPYLDGYAKMVWAQEQGNRSEINSNWKPQPKKSIPQPTPKPVFFDFDTFKQTLNPVRYEKNTFIQNLFSKIQFPFEVDEVTKVIELYRLGTIANGYRAGANTFPFIDLNNNVRAIQVKQFDEQNHTTATDFLHSIIEKHHIQNNKPLPKWLEAYIKQDKRITCLFGEHLLSKYHSNPIALVEAPKTAIYGSLYFGLPETPETLIWLAVYNKGSFSFDKLKVLQGRFVYVFPDLSEDGSTFNHWQRLAKDYESRLTGTKFIFSDLLEQLAPEIDKNKGKDIADYLIKQDWRLFRKRNIHKPPTPIELKKSDASEVSEARKTIIFSTETPPAVQTFVEVETTPIERVSYGNNWLTDIEALETIIKKNDHKTPIKLKYGGTIINIEKFIEAHLETVKANNGNKVFLPYLNRLQELKEILIN
jgi:hypothetical protein